MTEIKIPKLYKTQIVNIEGTDVEIRGYRFIDNEIIVLIRQLTHDLAKLKRKTDKLVTDETKKDAEYTDEEYDKIQESWKELERLRTDLEGLQYKLAQRGLKRAFYTDPKKNYTSEELDELPDIEIDIEDAQEIAGIMMDIKAPKTGNKGDTKKQEKSQPSKKSSKTSGKSKHS